MLIVDAQVHIWSQGMPSGQHRQISSYSAEDCLKEMDEGGVEAAVLYPPGWDPNDLEVAVEAARRYPNRVAILGHFPLDKPGNCRGSKAATWSWSRGARYATGSAGNCQSEELTLSQGGKTPC
jgi:predicted TIM-barrel fold metal-dependent hydrolase